MAKKSRSQRLQLADNARVVLERRYLAKDDAGNLIETPEDLFRRVADNIARAGFAPFAWYRIVMGLLIFGAMGAGWL